MKTPLNYTGNKSRLMDQFSLYFPKKVGTFVDLFCGGGTVGMSVNAERVIFIDNNERVVGLLQHLANSTFEKILPRLERLVEFYKLSYSAKKGYQTYRVGVAKKDNNGLKAYNSEGFYRLRHDYNTLKNKNTSKAFDMLYLLVVYAFNNDMRFNRSGEFNLPVGKTDLNKSNILKLSNYIERIKQIDYVFLCGDFRDEEIQDILFEADFVYADPPYLLGDAVYNEAGNWTEKTEHELIALFKRLDEKGKKFALSNVIAKVGMMNNPLQEWVRTFNRSDWRVWDINYHYRSSSYNKLNRDAAEREVLITNYEPTNQQ